MSSITIYCIFFLSSFHIGRYHVLVAVKYVYAHMFMFLSLSLHSSLEILINLQASPPLPFQCLKGDAYLNLHNLQVQFLGSSALHDCIQRLMV